MQDFDTGRNYSVYINVNVIMVIMLANFSLLSGNSTKIDLGSISKYNSLCFVSTKVYDIVYKRS